MNHRTIHVAEYDSKRLKELLELRQGFKYPEKYDLQELEAKLSQCRVVAPKDVPRDIITMKSKVRLLDLDTGEEMTYKLVYPDDADIDQNKISVLAPIGIAMLGHSVGDTFEWEVPAGLRRLRVKEILYQPELMAT